MQLQEQTSATLDRWVSLETWFKNHEADEKRFFDFVNAYSLEHGFTMDEMELQYAIEQRVQRWHQSLNDTARETIRKRVSLAYDILNFLKQTGR